jgi:hypothetical protein
MKIKWWSPGEDDERSDKAVSDVKGYERGGWR